EVVQRFAAGLEQARGLALIRDANARDLSRRHFRFFERALDGGLHRLPDRGGLVLDPTGSREHLAKLLRGAAANRQRLVDDERGGSGGTLVDGEDGLRHGGNVDELQDDDKWARRNQRA